MRRTLYIVMALALVIGFTQCKKEQPLEPQGEQVRITLDVNNGGNNGTRADVTPPSVSFVSGDQILVASGGHYVGFLTHDGTIFSGDITDPVVGEPLYFYFLGNKADVSGLTKGSSTTCTVNISDQTGYPAMPVISMGVSIDRSNHNATVNYSSLVNSYEAQLHNKASLMKFNVTTPSEAAICITGMKNKVTVHFNNPTDSGFEYNIDTEDGGLIKMKGQTGSGTKTYWAIVLPQSELSAGAEGSSYTADFSYIGTRPAIEEISANQYLSSGVAMTVNTAVWDGDLAKLTSSSTEEFATARDGMTIYGTLGVNKKVSIADGATVTLDGVSINAKGIWKSGNYAGITCVGDATIILSGTNTVKGFNEYYPGIYVPEGSTVTIKGSGSLTASSNGFGAGIGGGLFIDCGNIEIQGGTITATGGDYAAGIGSGDEASCGAITIEGGTVTATGGDYAAGIGSGMDAGCGDITITSGVTQVTATKGSLAPNSIGAGDSGSCGTVTIGGVVTGPISDSPYTYPVPLTYPIALGDATSDYVGSVVTTDGNVYATVAAASAASKTAVAIIAYVGTAGSVDATSDSYKGLAIALSDANSGSQCQWAEDFVDCLSSSQTSDITIALGLKDGIACTGTLNSHFHDHDAANAAMMNNGTPPPTGTSGWFMPSMGQWNLIVQGLATKKAGSAVTDDLAEEVENNTYKADNLNSVITDAGGTGLDADSYWASTEEDSVGAWVMDFWHGYATRFDKSVDWNVRSVIAF